MGKFITFGEIMFRFNPEGYLRLVQADKMELSIAGGEANVAVSLANYGLETYKEKRYPVVRQTCTATAPYLTVFYDRGVKGALQRAGLQNSCLH